MDDDLPKMTGQIHGHTEEEEVFGHDEAGGHRLVHAQPGSEEKQPTPGGGWAPPSRSAISLLKSTQREKACTHECLHVSFWTAIVLLTCRTEKETTLAGCRRARLPLMHPLGTTSAIHRGYNAARFSCLPRVSLLIYYLPCLKYFALLFSMLSNDLLVLVSE